MDATDEITTWLARSGRKALDLEAAKQLAAESPQLWYVASYGARGFLVGKMTMQKFSQRHILVDEAGQVVLFPTIEGAKAFLRTELKVADPHVFNF
ncbi:MAG: hypothetical protein A3I02_11420 [Betaproteobacteria bacterium RIFCSPLOWO2_02_FULL_67_26]|nr:MAG: hypothetical protein A3I02_11420 [Betaproteobacteria bacterium RIFCSPLOWO2_02_FULL_67_26]